jgi:pimeloyl-ACP methyl ester carboxylesterase
VGGLSPTEAAAVARIRAGDPDGAKQEPRGSYFELRPELFGVFVADMHRAVQRLDGYLRDNLSWCGPWDIDIAAVTAPLLLAYGSADHMVPVAHGEWLKARLPHAQLQVYAGGHGDITFGRAGDAYAYLARGRS